MLFRSGTGSGYQIKANALRKLGRKDEEIQLLRFVAEHETDAMAVFLRLIEEDKSRQDWASLKTNAQRAIGLNPFLRSPQQALAEAAEAQNEEAEAILGYRRVLILDSANTVNTHYRLAKLLRSKDAAQAKRHLLDALVLAPRFREAHALLREWETSEM